MANNIKQVSNVNGGTMNLGQIETAAIRGVEQGVSHFTGGCRMNVTAVNSATNLKESDCGYIALGVVGTQQAASTGFNVDLPTPAAGLWFKFVLAAPSIANNSNAAITITSTSDGDTAANLTIGTVRGHGDDNGANVVSVADVITFVHNKATAGDYAELWCDGTNWFADIVYDADDSITLA